MAQRPGESRAADTRTSRRHFFKLLAGSPMLAWVYPGLPPS